MEGKFETLTVEELCSKLNDTNVDAISIEKLRGAVYVCSLVKLCLANPCLTDNDIDGEALLLLVEDLDEFSHIITKAVSRLKIKKFVKGAVLLADKENSTISVCEVIVTVDMKFRS